MDQSSDKSDKYERISAERNAYVDAVLNCSSPKKTVVAGPGTGKTFLFKAVLAEGENCLTLTFVNALVEDLSLDLCSLSEVKTLHGYARSVLGRSVKVFPKLSGVIEQDAKVLLGMDVDFDKIFHNREDDSPHIEFYKSRKAYYDNYYGYSSIVYAAVMLFEANKDKIPIYHHILVDEFQDFNKLEVSLIDLLAEKSPVLLAGDDDQALYGFKGASADHIRWRHDDGNSDYASFTLPFCSRCTRIIVNSVNDVLAKSTERGNLCGRIAKQFRYFEDEDKDKESERYPKLVYAQMHARQIPWYIEQRMNEIAGEQRGQFSSLVIAPTKRQCHSIVTALRKKGLRSVESVESKEETDVGLLDGLRLLTENSASNLGWRIVARHLETSAQFKKLLVQTTEPGAKRVSELLDKKTRKEAKRMLRVMNKLKKGEQVGKDDLDSVLQAIGMDAHELKSNALYERIVYTSQRLGNPGLRKLPIKVTTIQSSKGLAADFVFITYFDDRYYIRDKDKSKISDQDICNFIVSLTRARKKVFLISSNTSAEPTFLDWIDANGIERVS